jgi:hypothetical protein
VNPLTAVPDSTLAQGVEALVTSVQPAYMVSHSRRTFHLGAQLLASAGRSFDAELLYVGSMLHDLTLGNELDDGVTPFHVRSAGIAAAQVLRAGRTDQQATLVYDAIALHLQLSTADDDRSEVAGVHLGATADVLGLRIDELSPEWVAQLLEAHPRLGMKVAVAELLAVEVKNKPYSPMAALVRDLALIDLIHAAPFDE